MRARNYSLRSTLHADPSILDVWFRPLGSYPSRAAWACSRLVGEVARKGCFLAHQSRERESASLVKSSWGGGRDSKFLFPATEGYHNPHLPIGVWFPAFCGMEAPV